MRSDGHARLAHWWVDGAATLVAAQPVALLASHDAWLAAAATRVLRRGQRWLQGLTSSPREPQTAEELLEYAFRIERDMPGLAADLRAAALRHQAAAG